MTTQRSSLKQSVCLATDWAAAVSWGDPLLCVWALAQSQMCPFREGRPEAKCRLSCPTGARDQQPMAQQLIAQHFETNGDKNNKLEVFIPTPSFSEYWQV